MDLQGDDFIRRYLRYTSAQESPLDFHLWMAIGIIGAAAARNVWIDMNYFKIYPNNYIILCSGSAKCRKGIALEIPIGLLREACPERRVLSEKITPEGMIRQLSKVETEGKGKDQRVFSFPLLVYSDELGVFMSRQAQQSGMPMLLTRLYTCPDIFEYVTKTQGTDKLREVCLNMFAGTTPGWLQRNIGADSFEEGCVGRTIFVYGDTPRAKNAWPEESQEEARLRKLLVPQLKGISEMRGKFEPTQAARDAYSEWYNKREPENDDELNSGFYGREHVHVLKTAMIFALSAGAELSILDTHITAAIDIIRTVKNNMQYALIGAGFEASVSHVALVYNVIKRHKMPITRGGLMGMLMHKVLPQQVDEAVYMLAEAGRINVIQMEGNKQSYALKGGQER